jgi:hypothetical protein
MTFPPVQSCAVIPGDYTIVNRNEKALEIVETGGFLNSNLSAGVG